MRPAGPAPTMPTCVRISSEPFALEVSRLGPERQEEVSLWLRWRRSTEALDYFAGNRLALDAFRAVCCVNCPNALLEPFHSQHISLEHFVLHGKTAGAPFGDACFHHHRFSEAGGQEKARTRLHHRDPGNSVLFQHLRLGKARQFKKRVGASVEKLKIARIIDNAQGITVAPFDVDGLLVREHGF
jgi:hypothetical protein